MLSYLKLVKIDHLMLMAIAQIAVKYGLLDPFGIPITLNALGLLLLIIATLAIAAAGNIIIEIYNQNTPESDDLSAFQISGTSANRLFIILNCIGVLIGFYISYMVGKSSFAAFFVIVSGLFYLYASYLKEIPVLKNIIIAGLITLVLLAVGFFDLIPAITNNNRASQTVVFSIIGDYAIFSFLIVLLRELVKDCLCIDEDYNAGLKTIPILLGKERTIQLIGVLSLLPLGAVIYYTYTYLFANNKAVLVMLLMVVAPLLFFTIKTFTSSTRKDLIILKLALKIILFLATLTMFFYQFLLT